MTITQFAPPTAEIVTAAMTLPIPSGEHFGAPVVVGYYPGQDEIWIEGEGGRQNIQGEHLNGFIRELRRARALALERIE